MRKLGAILSREFLATLRNGWAMAALGLMLLLVAWVFCTAWASQANSWNFTRRAMMSRQIFYLTSAAAFAIVTLISPIMNASAISREREGKTLDLLLCSGIPRMSILLGKWISSVGFQAMLIVLLMPLLALSFQLGGLGLDEYLVVGILILQAILVYGMVGLAVSCHFQRSATATMAAILLIMFLTLFWPVTLIIAAEVFGFYELRQQTLGGIFFSVSPIGAAFSIITKLDAGSTMTVGTTLALARPHLLVQLALFLTSFWAAWRGLNRTRTPRSATAKTLIDDPETLRRRSRTFPFYLIDPLKRAQDIADTQNPVYIREKRYGALSKLSTLIRVGYLSAMISVLIGLFLGLATNRPENAMRTLLAMNVCIAMAFVPILSSGTISREREEGTLDLLRITMMEPRVIIWGKFLASLRFLLFLLAGISAFPVILLLVLSLVFDSAQGSGAIVRIGVALAESVALGTAYTALHASMGMLISSWSRRTIRAIVLTYISLALLAASPVVMGVLGDITTEIRQLVLKGRLHEWAGMPAAVIEHVLVRPLIYIAESASAPFWLTQKMRTAPADYLWNLNNTASAFQHTLATFRAIATTGGLTILFLVLATRRIKRTEDKT